MILSALSFQDINKTVSHLRFNIASDIFELGKRHHVGIPVPLRSFYAITEAESVFILLVVCFNDAIYLISQYRHVNAPPSYEYSSSELLIGIIFENLNI